MIKDAIFYITGLNFTLVPNSKEHFLIFTSYYYWERKNTQRVLLKVIIFWSYLVSGWLLSKRIWLPSHLIRQNWIISTTWLSPTFPLISPNQPPLTTFQFLTNAAEASAIFFRLYNFPENPEVDLLNNVFIFPLKKGIIFHL